MIFRACALFALLCTGCVTSSRHQKLQEEHQSLATQLQQKDTALQHCALRSERAEQAATEARKGWHLVPVVVAAQDMKEGEVVTIDHVSQRSVPEQFVTSSVVKPDASNYIINQKLLVAVQRGDPLLWSQFETTKSTERLTESIPADHRVVTIDVGRDAGLGGWLRPHDRVDVIAFRRAGKDEMAAVTVLQNVLVLATGRITGKTNINLIPEEERRYSEVSFLVTARDAERLALAAEFSHLRLVLRNGDDKKIRPNPEPATTKSLFGTGPAKK